MPQVLKVWAGMKQACRQVLRFGGQNKLLGGQDLCFYYCTRLKQTFLGTIQFVGHKKFRDTAPECPHGYGPGINKFHLNSSKYIGCWL